jgi:hypothetical protein
MDRIHFRSAIAFPLAISCVALVCWLDRNSPEPDVQLSQPSNAPYSSSQIRRASIESFVSKRSATFSRRPEETPPWAIGFQKEFWKRTAEINRPLSTASALDPHLDLIGIIERISHAIRKDDSTGLARADDLSYNALFDQSGMRFSPHLPSESNANAPAGQKATSARFFPQEDPRTSTLIQTRSIDLGTQKLFSAESARLEWSCLGNTAQSLLNESYGLVQHYEAETLGMAATWIVTKPLGSHEPLLVELELSGLHYAGETEDGCHFADSQGTARVRLGKVQLVDSAGQHWDLQMQVTPRRNGAAIRIDAPPSVLESATYPIAIDPLIAPEFGMDNPVFVPAENYQDHPVVASNGTNLLVAWDDRRVGGIYGTRVNKSGSVMDPTGIFVVNRATPSGIAANGGDFLIVYQHESLSFTEHDIYGVRLSAEGLVLDPAGIPIAVGPNEASKPKVASNGSDYFVVWEEWQGRWLVNGARVSRTGMVYSPPVISICTATNGSARPDVASNGRDFLVVWEDYRNDPPPDYGNSDIYGARITADGLAAQTNGFPICALSADQLNPCIAVNGGNYMVVWEDLQRGLSGAAITASGGVANPNGLALGTSPNAAAPVCAPIGTNYVIVSSLGRQVMGTLIGSDLAARKTFFVGDGFLPRISGNGDSAFIVWSKEGTAGSDIYGASIAPSGQLNGNGFPLSIAAQKQECSAISRLGTNFLVAWTDYRKNSPTNSDIYGVRVTTGGQVLDPNGIAISTYLGTKVCPAIATDSNVCFVAWQSQWGPGLDRFTEIHGTTVTADGTVGDLNGILVTTNANPYSQVAVAWQCDRFSGCLGAECRESRRFGYLWNARERPRCARRAIWAANLHQCIAPNPSCRRWI